MTYISSQSLTAPMRTSILQAQSALAQAQTEISSGAPADLGLTLGANTGHVLSLRSDIDALGTYTQTNALATARLSATATALTSMMTSAQSLSAALVTAQTAGGTTTSLATTAQAALQGLIGQLNTTAGGQSVFGGINTGATAVSDYFSTTTSSAKSAVDSAFQKAFGFNQTSSSASTISGSAMQSFLDTQFSSLFSKSGWQSTWSSASSQTISSTIAPSQSTTTSVSANQGSFQTIAQAYTMLSEFMGSNMSADAKSAVVATASKLMSTGIASLTDVQAGVGVAQASISAADTQNSAQTSVLQTNASDLDSVDTYALSSRVTTLQTQLEATYQLTSRLQQLSLVNYLTSG